MRATEAENKKTGQTFLPKDFSFKDWSDIKPYYNNLEHRAIHSIEELEQWVLDRSTLEATITESFAWKYIHITRDSSDNEASEAYQYAVTEISPKVYTYDNILNKKLVESPFFKDLNPEQFKTYKRVIQKDVQLFHKENIPLATEVQMRSKEHGRIFSEMTIGVKGVQMTLQKAGSLLEDTDRSYRQTIYHKINQRILQDTNELEQIFDDLLKKRHKIAQNAGFSNFRDYKFIALGRFDYSVEDCLDFHNSIKSEILPLLDELNKYRKEALKLDKLRPWDLNVDTEGKEPLRPFEDTDELLNKTIQCLNRIHPDFANNIATMREMGHLDLASRKGKRPGGYNMPLHLTGVPFIFMNATNTLNDLRTLVHESGHAVHSFLTKDLELNTAKKVPSEVAELAAMSMELLTMEHWDVFFDNEEDLRRAKINQLETVLKVLPWVATIDKFQHWIYTHPMQNRWQRKVSWMNIMHEFSSNEVDYENLELYSEYIWHKQLHIFEVPFYYIEYGMAQLGAIAIWKKYKENPEKAIEQYRNALSLGYTKTIGEIYQAAGIEFNFSKKYVTELGAFVREQLHELIGK